MTAPAPPRRITYQQALAAAAALQTAAASVDTVTATAGAMSDAVAAAREAATAWALNLILGLWGGVDPFDGEDVQQFTAQAAGVMVRAQTSTVRVAAASQARQLTAMGVKAAGVPSNPVDVRRVTLDADGHTAPRDDSVKIEYDDGFEIVDLDEDATTEAIFNRPARTYRYQKSQGATDEKASAEAIQRMASLVDGNMMLAQRLAEAEMIAAAAATDRRVIGLRRIIHPELSRTGTCGLCIAASDQIYQTSRLLPLHDRCKCTVAAVTADFDPADVLNTVDLDQLYADAGATASASLKRTRYQVDEHGELGPVLVPKKPFKPRTRPQRIRRPARPVVAGLQP